jgi:hypothetical protein
MARNRSEIFCAVCGTHLADSVIVEIRDRSKPMELIAVCDRCHPLIIKGTLLDPAMRRR